MYKLSVCIKDEPTLNLATTGGNLMVGGKYLVKRETKLFPIVRSISKVKDIDGNYIGHFYSDQFCSIEEWREKQINKIIIDEN